MTTSVYCDGGVVVKNPSPYGGTWSWIALDAENKVIGQDSGIIKPKDVGMQMVSNNVAELFAALKALEAAPVGWDGVLHTDSQITLYRITNSRSFEGIPNQMRLKCLDLRRNRKWQAKLVKGHPTKKDLQVGTDSKGRQVSTWNVWCDKECQRLAKKCFTDERFINA